MSPTTYAVAAQISVDGVQLDDLTEGYVEEVLRPSDARNRAVPADRRNPPAVAAFSSDGPAEPEPQRLEVAPPR